MSVYSYPESKVIDEITFRWSEGGHLRAYMHANASARPDVLKDITRRLDAKGWQITPYNLSGKPTLEVHGMGSETQLIKLLGEGQWVSGQSHFVKGTEKPNLKDQVLKRSLGASGAFYLIGDYSFTKYGYEGADKLNLSGGLLYGAGTLALLAGGRKDQSDLQVRDIARKLDAYLKQHGEDMPKACSLDAIIDDHNRGLIKKADDLIRRYPSELMNLFYAGAGACIATSAYKHMHSTVAEKSIAEVYQRKRLHGSAISESAVREKMNKFHKMEGKLDIGLGTITGASGLFAMLVKEKARDPDAPPKHGVDAVWEWIRERPLAIAGAGYLVSTMCHAVSTTLAWNWSDSKRRSSVKWRATFVAANIIAELLLAISSKGHGEGVKSDKSVDNTVMALSAEMIAKQPAKMQEHLIDYVTQFLGRPDVLAGRNEDIKRELHAQVEAMRKNPWALCTPVQQAQGNEQPAQQPEKSAPAAWQTKVSQPSQGVRPQLS